MRAGGYGIAGWAVAGDVVVDMSLIKDIDIEPPLSEDEGACRWTHLRDMLPPGSKGKGRAGRATAQDTRGIEPGPARVKRRREDDDESEPSEKAPLAAGDRGLVAPNYDNASHTVSVFLRGPPLPLEAGEAPRQPPTNRRRLHSPEPEQLTLPAMGTRQISSESAASSGGATGSGSGSGSMSRSVSMNTAMTSPVDSTSEVDSSNITSHMPPSTFQAPFATGILGFPPSGPYQSFLGRGDPFSYMSTSGLPSLEPPVGLSGPGRSFAVPPNLLNGPLAAPGLSQPIGAAAPPRAVHTHAYVTFGAGARQKEVDMYTAENPLEGISGVTGDKEDHIVPYHVPSYVNIAGSENEAEMLTCVFRSAHPVGSSAMLLSGFGFLSRLHGLSSDNLVEVEMVLADGRIVMVSEEEHPGLSLPSLSSRPPP